MDAIRTLSTLGRAAREDAGAKTGQALVRKVRQPLARVVCVVPQSAGRSVPLLLDLLAAELNVKQVELATSADALVTLEAKPNFRTLGKKFGKSTPVAAQAVTALSSDVLRGFETGEKIEITVDGTTRELDADDLTIVRRAAGDLVVSERGGYFAAIDPALTPALRAEGIVREVVSAVQRMRKDAGLAVSDRIRLAVDGTSELLDAVREYREHVAGEVLAREISIGEGKTTAQTTAQPLDLDGIDGTIALTRIS
jgi:isoleucyl-tRNA synthetase